MTKVNPFAGLRFNSNQVKNLADVISPPYDKISPTLRDELWSRHPQNIVRLILPPPGDGATDFAVHGAGEGQGGQWYQEAARMLNEWTGGGVFQQDEPQFYAYHQTFPYDGDSYTRSGIFGALSLDAESGPHAHEFTFEGPKADRLRLIRAAKANLSPIFLLADGAWSDWKTILDQATSSLADFADHERQHHRLLALQNEAARAAADFLRERTLVIADGHHRYETAVNYCREMAQATGQDPAGQPWGSVMALIVPIESPGLLVLPTHRVLSNLPAGWLDAFQNSVQDYFNITPLELSIPAIQESLNKNQDIHAIAVVSREKAFLMSRKPDAAIASLDAVAEPIRRLNVSILHHYIFPQVLQLSPEDLSSRIQYIRGESEAAALVQQDKADVAFLLNGISPRNVFEISLKGVRMPQKSTDFYPKIPTGLLVRSVAS